MRIEDKGQWMTLAMQKPRAFQIEVVAKPTLNVHAHFTPTLSFNQFWHLKNICMYYTILSFKSCTYFITFYQQNVANTVGLSCSTKFTGSNKIFRTPYISKALTDRLLTMYMCTVYNNYEF